MKTHKCLSCGERFTAEEVARYEAGDGCPGCEMFRFAPVRDPRDPSPRFLLVCSAITLLAYAFLFTS